MPKTMDEPEQLREQTEVEALDISSHLLGVAQRLEQVRSDPFQTVDEVTDLVLVEAVTALRLAAAREDECRMIAPYSRMYRGRKGTGQLVWICAHPTPHEFPACTIASGRPFQPLSCYFSGSSWR